MEEMIFIFFLGVGITAGVYEFLSEYREKQISKLTSKAFGDILEGSSMRIGERAKILKRDLTEEEKNNVIEEFYMEYKENLEK